MRTSLEVRPGQVAKYTKSMSLLQVEMNGLKAHRYRYWTSSALILILYVLKVKGTSDGGGGRSRLMEVYIIQASAGVSLASNGDAVSDQLDVAFVEDGSESTVTELAY